MKRIQLSERKLISLIHRVINETELAEKAGTHNCSPCIKWNGGTPEYRPGVVKCLEWTQCADKKSAGAPVSTGRVMNEESGSITHDELMDGIDKMCIDRPWDTEKMVGNRSCSRCHSDLTDLIKGYCGSFPSEEETYLDDPGQTGVPSIKHQIAQKESVKRLIQRVITEHSGGKLKFNKQSRKKGAKTDIYNVVKGGTTIGQVKWYSRLRGYGFLPPSGDESEVTEFVKEISKTHREKNKKNKKKQYEKNNIKRNRIS